jgi:hypothetical protein
MLGTSQLLQNASAAQNFVWKVAVAINIDIFVSIAFIS